MNTVLTAAIISTCLLGAIALGIWLRRLLPQHHFSKDTKDAVKLAMGLVGTMSALLLGLLVSSAKSTFDAESAQVTQMAAKVAFLDRVLAFYGPDAAEVRAQLHAAVEQVVRQIWPEEKHTASRLAPDVQAGYAVYNAIQRLAPRDDAQRSLKTQAVTIAMEIGQLRSLLVAQSVASISKPLLVVVVGWLVVIFFSFSLFAPSNATATLALIVATLSVTGAIFLILELDRPFGGLIQVSSAPMLNTLNQLGK